MHPVIDRLTSNNHARGVFSWGEFVRERPDLAAVGRRLFYQHGLGLGFLATVRPDGGPRVHPICPILTDAALFALIVRGPKLNDLRRDRRFSLHSETSPPPRQDDAFYVAGVPVEVTDQEARKRVDNQFLGERGLASPWPGFAEQVLFELRFDRALVTLTAAEGGLEAGHTIWHAPG